MVIDFSDLKKIVKEEIVDIFDHATVFNQNTPHIELAAELKSRGHHVILVDYQPTSENMVTDCPKNKKPFAQRYSFAFAETSRNRNLFGVRFG
jgi:6-pyruvoyltetrahydropterin/6-carboxytetrahydropterin synthase